MRGDRRSERDRRRGAREDALAPTLPRPRAAPWHGWAEARAAGAAFGASLADAFREEVGFGRLALFLPVVFGAGIAAYFAAGSEPSLVAAASVTAGLAGLLLLARARPIAFPVLVTLLAFSGGFLAATIRTWSIAAPVLARPAGTLDVSGWVESVERRERGERLVIRIDGLSRLAPDEWPRRVRVTTTTHSAVKTGDFLRVKARLSPVPGPAMPGGYDFARDAFFAGIGASGFVIGKVAAVPPTAEAPLGTRLRAAIDAMRGAISARIRAQLSGDTGAIAVALVTGERAAISEAANDMLRASGLAHILSISGFHMALVAGLLFVAIRGTLSLVPTIALRRPIKKYAALGALAGTSFYMVLSGGEVATLRSWIMTSVVFLGVLADRPALTMRSLGFAALVLLALMPESLLHPSFQMSFAATMALVALYERGAPLAIAATRKSGLVRRALMSLAAIVVLSFATSLIAGLATTPYAAFHFHRVSVYGAIGNLIGSPIVSLLSMPLAMLAVLAMPFGLEGPILKAMGASLDLFLTVNRIVAELPGAVRPTPGFGSGALSLMTLGMIAAAVLVTRLRLIGVAVLGAGLVAAFTGAPPPVAFVTADGETLGVVGPNGGLEIHGRDRFAAQLWTTVTGRTLPESTQRLTPWPELTPAETTPKRGAPKPGNPKSGNPKLASPKPAPDSVPPAVARPPPITFLPAPVIPAIVDKPPGGVPMRCDATGCVFTLPGGKRLSYARHQAAFADDCEQSAIVVTPLFAPPWCRALTIDARRLRATGAILIRHDRDGGFTVLAARPEAENRPWYRRPPRRNPPPSSTQPTAPQTIDPTEAPDATAETPAPAAE